MQERESRTLEFKESVSSNTFLKTISAYANYGDGKIIFGINDNGDVIGIEDPITACLNIENKINDSMHPVPSYELDVQDDHTIILTVSEGLYKPYLYKGKAYKRNDSATIEVDRLEYNRLVLEGTNRSFDELPSEQQQLSFSLLEKYLIDLLGIEGLNQDILKTLDLYSEKTGYNMAAALLADCNRFKGIDIVKFGSTIDEIMDRKILEGISVIHQLYDAVEMFKRYYQYEKIDGTERKLIERIPEKAFREAVANAIVHRLWDVNASIKISMFEDHIEITSPGGLPSGISEDEYLNGQISLLRNPILANVFFRLRFIEKFGTGIRRIRFAYSELLRKPDFKVYENSITIILPVALEHTGLTRDEQQILELLADGKMLSRTEIENAVGMNKDKVIRLLNSMMDNHLIQKSGKGRGTRYLIN